MKLAVVLLSILVMFLNAVPCCWDVCDDGDPVEHTGENSGSEDFCSPFLSCGSCAGFILQEELPKLTSFNFQFRSIDEQRDSKFLSDYTRIIWSPPKNV